MCSKSLWSLEWTTAEPAQPRLGYIRKGLNGIKDSADVSQLNICPLGLCFVGPLFLLLLLFFFYKWAAWIKGRRTRRSYSHCINSDVCSAFVPECTCLKERGLIWGFFVVLQGFWSCWGKIFKRSQEPWRCSVPVSVTVHQVETEFWLHWWNVWSSFPFCTEAPSFSSADLSKSEQFRRSNKFNYKQQFILVQPVISRKTSDSLLSEAAPVIKRRRTDAFQLILFNLT